MVKTRKHGYMIVSLPAAASLLLWQSLVFAAPIPRTPVVALSGPKGYIPKGATVEWSAAVENAENAEFEFWVRIGGSRRVIQSYSSASTVLWKVPIGISTLGVTVKGAGLSPLSTSVSVTGVPVTGSHRSRTVPVDSPVGMGGPKPHRFWVANPVGDWMTLGAFRSGRASWTPRFPGRYPVAIMTKGPNSAVTAQEEVFHAEPQPNALVALGDSVTFGWNLGNNWNPSPEAFPYLLGKAEHLPVDDLGYPGWTSAQLLAALGKNPYQKALSTAKVVTIDIGNNDLLQMATKDGLLGAAGIASVSPTAFAQLAAVIGTIGSNLGKILLTVKSEAPRAKVVVYNLYDPVAYRTLIGPIARKIVVAADAVIAKEAAAAGLPVADAYGAFSGNLRAYVQSGNFHPTAAGQRALAVVGEKALASMK